MKTAGPNQPDAFTASSTVCTQELMSVPFCMATTTKGSAVKIVLPRMTFFMSASEGLAVVSALPPPLEDWGCSESENLNLSVAMGGHRVGE